MNVGFIGVGGITRPYRQALRQLDQSITAVCDVNPETLAKVAAEESAAPYQDYRQMLDEARLDAVLVCLPPGAHREQVIDAATRGLAVFVAKPVALDLDTAKRTCDAIAARGVVNQSGYMWRSADATAELQRLVAERTLGLVVGQVLVSCPGTPWWGVTAMSGGQVVEQATHVIDLMRYLAGDIEAVCAWGHQGLMDDHTDFEDSTAGTLRFTSGAVGTLATTYTGGLGRYSICLSGRDLCLELTASAQTIVGKVDGEDVLYKGTENGMTRQIKTFCRACASGDQSLIPTSYADATASLAVTLAYNQSLMSGEPVSVPTL